MDKRRRSPTGQRENDDRHQGRFLGLWGTEEDIRMLEAIKRRAGFGSQSAAIRYAIQRAYAFMKDERGG